VIVAIRRQLFATPKYSSDSSLTALQ